MDALAITHRGFEKAASLEIAELLKIKDIRLGDSVAEFSATPEQLAELCYRAQSLSRAMIVLGSFALKGKDVTEELEGLVNGSEISIWLKDRTFRVNCEHLDKLDLSGLDIAEETGAFIVKKTKAKARMTDPDVIVLVYITSKKCYLGIDFSGFDMSKRDYKIYSHPSSMNGAVAYSLLRVSGYKKGMAVLDPFCGSGIIPIEAALYEQSRSPNFFRKDKFAFHKLVKIDLDKLDVPAKKETSISASDHLLSCVKATRNNAKIADIDKSIAVTKADMEWLDTKFDEGSIDLIVTNPPVDSKTTDKKQVEKVYREFFHQAEFILKDNGKMAVFLPKTDCFKENISGFKVTEEFSIFQGKQGFFVLILAKNSVKNKARKN